jgi:hypothetical protein
MLETLRTDFQRLPGLLELGPPEQPQPTEAVPEPELELPEPEALPAAMAPVAAPQLGLF